jgi:glycosyltransferase involved in cell wall biosynthesis
MNIGILAGELPYLPARDGFRLYTANILRTLAQRHQIDLVSPLRDEEVPHLAWAREHCASVTLVPVRRSNVPRRVLSLLSSYLWGEPLHLRTELRTLLREAMTARRWDVLHVEGSFVAGAVPQDLALPSIVSVHDSWTLRCDELLRCATSAREKLYYLLLRYHEARYQRLVYPRFQRCILVAPRDAATVERSAPGTKVVVIPNGVDTQYYRPLGGPRSVPTLCFHGNLGYAPNIEAALELANILPRVRAYVPEAILHLIGADPALRIQALKQRPGVRLSENLPDLRTAVGSASIYACAMRHGTGIKNKLLEAMALGVPIVCYPEAATGINAQPGRDLLVVEDAVSLAATVVDLLQRPERAQAIARAARALVEREYSWESRGLAFEDTYRDVIAERRAGLRVRCQEPTGGSCVADNARVRSAHHRGENRVEQPHESGTHDAPS